MRASVHIRTLPDSSAALGWTHGRSVTIDRACEGGSQHIGFSAAELLCLAVGACYTHELFLEAARRDIRVGSVHIDVAVDDADPDARQMTASLRLEADADEATISELVEHADRVAMVPNLLRLGTSVRLTDAHVIARKAS